MDYQLDMHVEMLLGQYLKRLPVYERMAQLAYEALRRALDAQHVNVTTIEHRVKTEASLAGKLELKGGKYHTLNDVTDIVGMRVVTFYSADVDKVAAIVNELFDVDWSKSVDKRKLHRLDSFGYNSLHYIYNNCHFNIRCITSVNYRSRWLTNRTCLCSMSCHSRYRCAPPCNMCGVR